MPFTHKLDKEKIIQLYQDGVSSVKIAEIFSCSPNTILRLLKVNNIEVKRPIKCRKLDLKNQKFGKLLVLETYKDKVNKHGQYLNKCICDCGKERIVSTNALRAGRVYSCGCTKTKYGKENHAWKGFGVIPQSMWYRIKKGAIKRKINISITIEDLLSQWEKQNGKCALSGMEISLDSIYHQTYTASLDRKDSTKGYEVDNIQWVHKDINMMKQAFGQEHFINLCEKISNYKRGKENAE